MQRLYSKIFIAILCTAFVLGCKSTPKQASDVSSGPGKISINSVTWMIERLDTSIWNGTLKGNGEMFVSFFIKYDGSFDTNDVRKLLVESPVDMWILNAAQLEKITEIDDKAKIASVKRLQCGLGAGSVALGKWKFTLTDVNGNKYEQILDITGFEKKAQDKTIEAKAEEGSLADVEAPKEEIKMIVPQVSAKNEIAALSVPVIKSVSKDSDSIEIFFSVNDERVKNGYFWFDVPGEKYYKDSGSMVDASGKPVNGCRVFSKDGKDCRYILRKDDSNSEWFNKITACFFVVSDTNRVSSPWEERNRAVSAKAEVK
ncbi:MULTISPECIES: hypothetical protein [unclassified Treponema]|uniref:hypothetical protein n=1 Tax=unclassified Treponema TaxID=2638727 RepID=UPI0020A28CE9|nr:MULTISPECIES: hypothetical protein [unclassified Treponema]UTC67105.1 hypothetical protein E4O06_00070 [Treponema sp. OMZ 789]UTC69836.1 hypothetical protein E4O01_00070 [Treponema sp. OMZ 790]UTC72550.1 hypothetical protein E4O02_00070 [Treponema sp. OMZ 791]